MRPQGRQRSPTPPTAANVTAGGAAQHRSGFRPPVAAGSAVESGTDIESQNRYQRAVVKPPAVLGVLAPAARDVKVSDAGAELVVLSASFLVPRDAMPGFDKALERVNAWGRGRVQLDCVGPLPPYSFVDLRL